MSYAKEDVSCLERAVRLLMGHYPLKRSTHTKLPDQSAFQVVFSEHVLHHLQPLKQPQEINSFMLHQRLTPPLIGL